SADSIAAMSLFEPMTIPTRGASTSMPANSSSGSVTVSSVCSGWLSAAPPLNPDVPCSLISFPTWSGHRIQGDVASNLLAVKLNHVRGSICCPAGVGGIDSQPGHGQDPSPSGRELAGGERSGARMGDLHRRRHTLQT